MADLRRWQCKATAGSAHLTFFSPPMICLGDNTEASPTSKERSTSHSHNCRTFLIIYDVLNPKIFSISASSTTPCVSPKSEEGGLIAEAKQIPIETAVAIP